MPCDRMQLCFVLWRPCRLALWNSVGFSHLHTDNRVRMWSHWKQSRCMANCRSRMRKWQEESQGIYFWIAKLSRSQINCRISTLGRSNYIVFFSWKTKFYLWRWERGQKRHRTRRARPKTGAKVSLMAGIKSAEAAIFVSNAWILWAQRCANKDCCLVQSGRREE